jgi:hypothetical protein
MAHRTLLTAGLLLGGLGLAPAALAGSNTYQSAISEVDACNQAQYLMPAKATVQGFVLKGRHPLQLPGELDRQGQRPAHRPSDPVPGQGAPTPVRRGLAVVGLERR